MADPKITLEYIRTLIWPLFAGMVLLLYQNDISGMISRGVELNVLGVVIKGASGDGVEELRNKEIQLRDAVGGLEKKLREQAELNRKLTNENDYLRKNEVEMQLSLAEAKILAGEDPTEIFGPTAAGDNFSSETMDVVSASRELEQDIQQDLKVAQLILAGDSGKAADRHESEGFENILAGNWTAALRSFQAAYEAFPKYHNVDEIRKLLRRNLDRLESGDKSAQQKVLDTIVRDYSWGVPLDVIIQMKSTIETLVK